MRRGMIAAGILTAVLTLAGCGDGGIEAADTQEENTVREDTAEENTDTVKVESESSIQGGTFSVLGDSISTFEGYNSEGCRIFFPHFGGVHDVEDTWWRRAADDLGWTLLENSSSAGATVVGDSTGTDDPQCSCNEFRTGGLAGPDGDCPDRIIIYLGANDMVETVPLGDNDGSRPVEEGVIDSFSDAYTLMLDKLEAKYPEAEIYCCTLHRMGNFGTETPYVEFVNGIGLTAADYGEAIAGIAKTRGLSVIYLYNCGITVENMQETTSDGVHPTAAGMEYIAEAVKKAITG